MSGNSKIHFMKLLHRQKMNSEAKISDGVLAAGDFKVINIKEPSNYDISIILERK